MPKVSIIMGVYNCKNIELLKKSINSIIKQTFLEWEFIICNDGSTNDTQEQLESIAKKDDRIKLIGYKVNRGLNYALNQCLKVASGEYIARQDDDDISYINRLEKQVEFLDNHKEYAIVGVMADVYDDNGVWGEYRVVEKPKKEDFLWNSPFMHPTVMIRAAAYTKCNGYRISRETRRCEDLDLFMRLYASGYKGYNIQEKLYKYRLINDPKKKYRPMKYRIDEAKVRLDGYIALNLMPKGIIYVLKPILIGLIPQKILYRIKKDRY